MKYEYSDIFDGTCTLDEYYGQFKKPNKLEIGKIYRQKGSIYHLDFEIVWADDKTAVGEVVSDGNGGSNKGQRSMFHNSELKRGFKYEDTRPGYRLLDLK